MSISPKLLAQISKGQKAIKRNKELSHLLSQVRLTLHYLVDSWRIDNSNIPWTDVDEIVRALIAYDMIEAHKATIAELFKLSQKYINRLEGVRRANKEKKRQIKRSAKSIFEYGPGGIKAEIEAEEKARKIKANAKFMSDNLKNTVTPDVYWSQTSIKRKQSVKQMAGQIARNMRKVK